MSYIRNHPNYFEDLARQKYDLNLHLDKSKLADTDVAFVKENYLIDSVTPITGFSPKTLFNKIAKITLSVMPEALFLTENKS